MGLTRVGTLAWENIDLRNTNSSVMLSAFPYMINLRANDKKGKEKCIESR